MANDLLKAGKAAAALQILAEVHGRGFDLQPSQVKSYPEIRAFFASAKFKASAARTRVNEVRFSARPGRTRLGPLALRTEAE